MNKDEQRKGLLEERSLYLWALPVAAIVVAAAGLFFRAAHIFNTVRITYPSGKTAVYQKAKLMSKTNKVKLASGKVIKLPKNYKVEQEKGIAFGAKHSWYK